MSCACINSCHPGYFFSASFPPLTTPEKTSKLTTLSSTYLGKRLPKISLNVKAGVSRAQVCRTLCLFGGKGKASNDNETSPWKALEKAMGNLKKEPSVEDLLKQQIEKQEYYEGGDGGDRPGGGGGGGSDGSGEPGDGWEPEDEDIIGTLKEIGQFVLAAMGLVFAYMYILHGEEIQVFAKDILKFIFLRQKSVRLGRKAKEIKQWVRYLRSLGGYDEEEDDPYGLQKQILATPTQYYVPPWTPSTPMRRRLRSSSYDSDAMSELDDDDDDEQSGSDDSDVLFKQDNSKYDFDELFEQDGNKQSSSTYSDDLFELNDNKQSSSYDSDYLSSSDDNE